MDPGHATRVRKGERPLPPYPPTKTRPNILLAGTPKQGSKAQIRDTPRRRHATGKPPADRRPRLSPLHSVTSVPLRSPVSSSVRPTTAGEDQMCATPRGCGRGRSPYRRTPHEDAPEHLTGRDAKAGKQSRDQGHATAEAGDTVRSAASPTPKRPAGKNNHPGDRPATRAETESARPTLSASVTPTHGPDSGQSPSVRH